MVHKHFSANDSALRIALCSLLFVLCTLCDVQSATPFSQYGQIQNVPNYSSNPFWDPSGPYNQRMPTPVYVDGPEMNAGDCLRTVSALVANVCATVNNCAGMQLSDIRPTLMLQLSQLPGHTYATSCAGYIDTEFEKYVKKYGHAGVTSGTVSFPTATTPQTTFPTPTTSVRNPYSPQTPEWEREYNERAATLAQLQEQTATHGEELSHTDFPATFADLDFDERMDVLATGYDPYQGKSAYHPIKIQSYEDYLEEMKKYAKYTISYSCGIGTGTPPDARVVKNGESFVVSQRGECRCPGDQTFGDWKYDDKTYSPGETVKWTFGTDATFVQKCDPKQTNPEQKPDDTSNPTESNTDLEDIDFTKIRTF